MKTDQKILELVSDCKKALDNESFAYAKHVVFGMAPLLIEAVEQLFAQQKDAYAQTDKAHSETLTLRNDVADLKAQLTVAERISNDRNEARAAGLREAETVRNALSHLQKECAGHVNTIHDIRDALGLVSGQNVITESKSIRNDRDSLRLKLETQTKIAVACQDAVDKAACEQVERMKAIRDGKLAERVSRVSFDAQIQDPDIARIVGNWESYHGRFKASAIIGAQAILADLAQMPIELISVEEMTSLIKSEMHVSGWSWDTIAIGICGMLRNRIAPLLAAHNATKIELPSIEEMHEQFDKGFEEAYGEASMTCHGADQNGLRLARELIAERLGLVDQKPTNVDPVAPVDKAQLDTTNSGVIARSIKAPTILEQFYAESGRTELSHNGSTVTLSDLRSLIGVLDR